jgi:hypothetical protein
VERRVKSNSPCLGFWKNSGTVFRKRKRRKFITSRRCGISSANRESLSLVPLSYVEQ